MDRDYVVRHFKRLLRPGVDCGMEERPTYTARITILVTQEMIDDSEFLSGWLNARFRGDPLPPQPPEPEPYQWPRWVRSLVLRLIPASLWVNLLTDEGWNSDD